MITENPQLQLKVCGLTKSNQIQELADLNVKYLGFIFYDKSPRYVQKHLGLKEISKIPHLGKVGVFVNESSEKIIQISQLAGLNFIQLHGGESPQLISSLRQNLDSNIKIIKAIRIGNQTPREIQNTINQQPQNINHFLFDTDSYAFGGTGMAFDWNILDRIEIPKPYFLSGGISMENYNQLAGIKQKPFALDINSKFETEPGNKDIDKIKTFKSKINDL